MRQLFCVRTPKALTRFTRSDMFNSDSLHGREEVEARGSDDEATRQAIRVSICGSTFSRERHVGRERELLPSGSR